MKVRINGKEGMITEKSQTLQELVVNRGLLPSHVVVEVNRTIIPKEQWMKINLQDNDCIEIVSFVGGG